MSDAHVLEALAAWEPEGPDLPDEVVAHLDRCGICRAAFDVRFAPAPRETPVGGRGRAVLGRLRFRPRPPWALLGGLAVAAALLLALFHPRRSLEPRPASVAAFVDVAAAWTAFEASDAALDGAGALVAAEAYLRLAPRGPHADAATDARKRLVLVGAAVGGDDIRWLSQTATQGDGWVGILWQVWCHFCVPALRRIEALHLPVPVAALTSASRGTTDDAVRDATAGLNLPVGVLGPSAGARLDTSIWPTAVLVCAGHVAWAGAPEVLTVQGVAAGCRR